MVTIAPTTTSERPASLRAVWFEPEALFDQPMQADQYLALPQSERFRLDLIDGYIYMSPRPSFEHQRFVVRLAACLIDWVERHGLGRVSADVDVRLSKKLVPAPDVVFLAAEHLDRLREGLIHGLPDLVVEVLSPSTARFDRGLKAKRYAKAGIPWYWIVDRDNRFVEEFKLVGAAYGRPRRISFDRGFRPRVFPGLTIDLATLESHV